MKKLMSFTMIMVVFITTVIFTNFNVEKVYADDDSKYVFATKLVNAGDFGPYNKSNKISTKDPHYNWNLGDFVMTGYTSYSENSDGNVVFLKTVDDEITLSFDLQQDIDKLNGNKKLFIDNDKKGQDEILGTQKTNFKKGALLIRYTDPDNKTHDTQIYTNFLSGNSKGAENMSIVFNEEGTYEVALDYKIESSKIKAFGGSLGTHNRYRMSFEFAVQNGTNTGFIFNNDNGQEIEDMSVVSNGFYIDLANSRYIDVEYKWEILNNDGTKLITQESAVAKDGDVFTKEGIYTITFKNEYVDEDVTRRICVGENKVLENYIHTGKIENTSITYKENMVSKTRSQNNKEQDTKVFERGGVVLVSLTVIIIAIILKKREYKLGL